MDFIFYKKHIPLLRMKINGSVILMGGILIRILIFDATSDTDQYILINLYNANTETEQLKILEEHQYLLKFFE